MKVKIINTWKRNYPSIYLFGIIFDKYNYLNNPAIEIFIFGFIIEIIYREDY